MTLDASVGLSWLMTEKKERKKEETAMMKKSRIFGF